MRRRRGRRITQFMIAQLLRLGRFVGRLRPIRWLARRRAVRIAGHIFAVLWYALTKYIWRPVKRLVRRVRKFLGRHEAWQWMAAWAACGLLAFGITLGASPLRMASIVLGLLYFPFAIIRPFEAFLIWIVVGPLAENRGFELGSAIPNLTFDRVALTAILASIVLRKVFSRKTVGKVGKVDVVDFAVGAFVIICSVNLLLTRITMGNIAEFTQDVKTQETVQATRAYVNHYLYAFATFYIVRNLVDDTRKIRLVLVAMAIIAVYLVPIGVFEHFTGKSWFTETQQVGWQQGGINRAQGPLKGPAVYGATLGVCLVIFVYLFFQSKAPAKRLLYLLGIIGSGVGEVMTFTRSAWLSPALALLVLAVVYEGKRKVLFAWITAGVVVLALFLPIIQRSAIFGERVMKKSTIESRMLITRNTMEMIKDKPVFGFGINNFDFYKWSYPVYVPGIEGYVGPTSHNTFLTILVEVGLLGAIPYLLIFAILSRYWVATYARASGNPLVGGRELVGTIGAATVCYFVTAMVIDMRFFRYTEYLFWALLALICVQYSVVRSSRTEETALEEDPKRLKRRYLVGSRSSIDEGKPA